MQKKELFKELRTEADADQTTPMPEEKAEAPTTRKRGRPKKAAESTPKKPARKPEEAKKETLAEKSAPQDEMPVEGTETPQESKEKKNGRPFSVWLQDLWYLLYYLGHLRSLYLSEYSLRYLWLFLFLPILAMGTNKFEECDRHLTKAMHLPMFETLTRQQSKNIFAMRHGVLA